MRLIELVKRSITDRKELVDFINKYVKDYQSRQALASTLFDNGKRHSYYEIKKALYQVLSQTEIVLEYMDSKTTRGYYMDSKKLIALNPKLFNAGTVIHEMTHAVQHQLGYGFDDYISYSSEKDNYKDYRYQLVEYEAFMMGDTWESTAYQLRIFIKKQIKKGLAI